MKVALCLSGFAREYHKTFPALKKHLLDLYDVDVFIHTWSKPDRHMPKPKEGFDFSMYEPKACLIEEPKTFDIPQTLNDKNIFQKRDLNGIFAMYYGIYESNLLRTKYEEQKEFEYDVVVRSRFDLLHEEKFEVEVNNLINIPLYGDFFGVNDQLAYGSSENMDDYSSCFLHLKSHSKIVSQADPELLLQAHFLSSGLAIKRFQLKASSSRSNT